jgi:hypothetical protein
VPHFVFHAPRVAFRPPLQLLCDVVLEVSNHELRQTGLRRDDITIS